MHSWGTFGVRTSHGQLGHTRLTTARTWGKPPPSPLYYTMRLSTGGTSKWLFVPKLQQLGLARLWGCITSFAYLRSPWGLKQSCSPHQELSNGMLHVAYTQGNRVDSQLLMVGSQTANLTLGLSFGHNLCFKCPNGSYEPILDIYVSISFQWYKELFEPMGFDTCNQVLKIQKSSWNSTPTIRIHLGVWGLIPLIPSHFLHSQEHVMWLPSLPLHP